ncbi:hypothetical protein LCGC14_1135790 [marine sediment metagenome]|uniref:KOW domain-containing protein n=1 Tax=marine sediment metagenome TaxID=412755 RepID=A0A0F9M4K5_9ZZZZ
MGLGPAMRVRVTTPPWAGQLGTIESIDGAYHIVRLDSSEHEDDVQELYLCEFEAVEEEEGDVGLVHKASQG